MDFNGRLCRMRFATTAADLALLRSVVHALVSSRHRLYLPATIVVDCVPEGPSAGAVEWATGGFVPEDPDR